MCNGPGSVTPWLTLGLVGRQNETADGVSFILKQLLRAEVVLRSEVTQKSKKGRTNWLELKPPLLQAFSASIGIYTTTHFCVLTVFIQMWSTGWITGVLSAKCSYSMTYVVNLMTTVQDMSDILGVGEKLVCCYLLSQISFSSPFYFYILPHPFIPLSAFPRVFLHILFLFFSALTLQSKCLRSYFITRSFTFCFQCCSWGFSKGEPGSSWWSRASCHVSISNASCPSFTERLMWCGREYDNKLWPW